MLRFAFRAVLAGATLFAALLVYASPRKAGGPPRTEAIDFLAPTGALSPPHQDYRQNIHLTYNGTRDAALLTYTTLSDGLWAQYWNGKTFTPAVNIVPPGASATSVIGDRVCHAFINAVAGISAPGAWVRNGDAVILFTAVDVDDDGAASADGKNRCLYSAYFDATYAADPAHNYGFLAPARISPKDGFDENVICHGFVSDGLIGEARYLDYQYRYAWGDTTSGIGMFWTQAENIDGDAAVEDLATWGAFFDLAQSGPSDVALVATTPTRIATANFGASDVGSTADQTRTDARYIAYNNLLVMRCAANASGLGAEPDLWDFGSVMHQGDDVTLQCVSYDFKTLSISAANVLQGATPSATDTKENNAMPLRQDGSWLNDGHAMYGTDEGLTRDVIVFAELCEGQANTNWGTKTNNARLSLAELDPATGAVLGRCFLDDEDPLITDSVGSQGADLRLSRNGDYVEVAWLETKHEGAVDDKALWAAQYTTARTSSPAPFADRVSAAVAVNKDADNAPVNWFAFEEGLEYVYGAQSNASVMNIFYEQSGAGDDQVWGARITADLAPAPTALVSSVSLIETFEEGAQAGMGQLNTEHWLFNGTDNGKDGQPITFYVKNLPTDPKAGLSLYCENLGSASGVARIDRPHPYTQVDLQAVALSPTSVGSEIATSGSKRTWSWSRVHVLWTEDRTKGLDDLGSGLYTRFWDAKSDATSFADRFVPAAEKPSKGAAEPVQLDWEGSPTDVVDQPEIRGMGREGQVVGLWFTARAHVWYQEFAPAKKGYSWLAHGGSADPVQVDDDTPLSGRPRIYNSPSFVDPGQPAKSVGPMKAFFTHSGTASTLDGAMYFYIKDIYDDGLPLLFVRVRDKD